MQSLAKIKLGNVLVHWMVLIQLGLAAYVVKQFSLEPNLHLQEVLLFAIAGTLPLPSLSFRGRQVHLLIISLVALFYFYTALESLIICIAGISLIATSIYIRPKWFRNMMLTLMAFVFIYFTYAKSLWIKDHILAWGVLGSMFLYRIFYFQHSINLVNTDRKRLSLGLTYYFSLPQMAMSLFPPILPKNMIDEKPTFYSLKLAWQGIGWIVFGILQLLLYRIIYIWFFIPSSKVTTILDFAGHTSTNYLLLLRWSGIIHIAIGLLQTLGFRVPAAFNNYFIASGFFDFCRRFYMPLRLFLIRIFYNRSISILRSLNIQSSQTGAILSLFFFAWMFHSAQWYILNGHFPLRIVDLFFWILFGLLVTLDLQLFKQTRKTNNKALHKTMGHALGIIATFSIMSLLYSLSSTHSLAAWLEMLHLIMASTYLQWATFGLIFIGIALVLMVYLYLMKVLKTHNRYSTLPLSLLSSYWPVIALLMLIGIQNKSLIAWGEARYSFAVRKILHDGPGKSDNIAMAGGYYSELISRSYLHNKKTDVNTAIKEQFETSEGAIEVNDFRLITLRPDFSFIFKGKPFSINAMGFRDKNYIREPAPNSIRTIILGSSFVVGSGVADDEVFDHVLETRMNKANASVQYEFINGGCSTYDLINCIVQFDKDSLYQLKPDYLFIFSHGVDIQKNIKDIAVALQEGISLPYPYLEDILKRSGINPEMSQYKMMAALEPFGKEIIKKSYELLYTKCYQHGIQPVFVYWPTVGMRPTINLEIDTILPLVVSSGYKILDLRNVYSGYDPSTLYVAPNDRHPNALGHQLIAEELERLIEKTQILKKTNIPPSKIPVK